VQQDLQKLEEELKKLEEAYHEKFAEMNTSYLNTLWQKIKTLRLTIQQLKEKRNNEEGM
jgi:hypothetical protein